ncbi:MAG: N-acetylmuramoyl-L-alanine amidase [Chloroflexi bacterium]|nr:N-acetylmuramoyl-L-alanine amidase [Chloroflexota bacterium]
MHQRLRRAVTLVLATVSLLLISLVSGHAEANRPTDPAVGRPDQAVLIAPEQPAEPAAGVLAALDEASGYAYLSPVTAAPRPFTHLLLRWEAVQPAADTVSLEVRVSLDGNAWSPWGVVLENPDLWLPEDGDEVHWSDELYAGEGARFWQVRARLTAGPDGALPVLRRIEVNTVDARFGPAAPQPDPPAAMALAQLSRPPVVSRSAWGNPDGQGSRVPPSYYPVRHLVIHHTADANSLSGSQQSWADRVRAIWSFHTFTRGWGDIGYNYLVDPNGVIYEGRAGGDDAVAFHDTANYGSLGVVLIGTYASVSPTTPAVDSLVSLLAWKAEQKGLDPLGRSFYYGCSISRYCSPFNPGAVVSTISGHRDVTPGHTTCPGDRLAAMLPSIRQRVRDRLSGVGPVDNGDLTIDDRESSFERSAANWYEGPCGFDGYTAYTFGTDNPAESTNRGRWRPAIPEAGRYHVVVHIPRGCGLPQATARAVYSIAAADGLYQVTVNQNTAEEWVSLGAYTFNAGRQGYVELSDLTGEPLISQRVVYFDSVRWLKEDPAAARVDLLNVRYDRLNLGAGELLKVTFTVRNSGTLPVEGQAPEAGRVADGSYNLADSYVYDEAECFLGAAGQAYPSYPKELGRIRLTLGPLEAGRQPACAGDSGGYPWRWGINGRLAPGETRDVVGYVRLRTPGSFSVRAGLINEYVGYFARDVAPTGVTVTAERQLPVPVAYDELLRPLAHVYRADGVPDNLLGRTPDGSAALRGDYLGSFVWQGEVRTWGPDGPLARAPDVAERLIIEQTRVVVAPVAGQYTVRLNSDAAAWLWVDGQLVVSAAGRQDENSVEATVTLSAGRHVLAFRSVESGGTVTAGYALRAPGATTFGPPIDGLVGTGAVVEQRLGATVRQLGGLALAADDMGGSAVARLRVSVNGGPWVEQSGPLITLGALPDGQYSLRYLALDGAGNQSAERTLNLRVDSRLEVRRSYLPLTAR